MPQLGNGRFCEPSEYSEFENQRLYVDEFEVDELRMLMLALRNHRAAQFPVFIRSVVEQEIEVYQVGFSFSDPDLNSEIGFFGIFENGYWTNPDAVQFRVGVHRAITGYFKAYSDEYDELLEVKPTSLKLPRY